MTKDEAQRVEDTVWLEDHFWNAQDIEAVWQLEIDHEGSGDFEVMVHFKSGSYLRICDGEGCGRKA